MQHFLYQNKAVHFIDLSYHQESMSIALSIFKINVYIIKQIQLTNIIIYHLLDYKINRNICKQS